MELFVFQSGKTHAEEVAGLARVGDSAQPFQPAAQLGSERQTDQCWIEPALCSACESIEHPVMALLLQRQTVEIGDQSPGQQTR